MRYDCANAIKASQFVSINRFSVGWGEVENRKRAARTGVTISNVRIRSADRRSNPYDRFASSTSPSRDHVRNAFHGGLRNQCAKHNRLTRARPRASLQPVTRLLKKRSPELLMVPEPEVCLSPE